MATVRILVLDVVVFGGYLVFDMINLFISKKLTFFTKK